ncbi:MAG TPA: DUF2497 domain-containing protein [Stellaceae bacterium]|jgi:cell pole-organizing protein PopZ|nr:DUF2497 domain-containing protein [Stellaceae bacterium]
MSDAKDQHEPSMEEILASIRRIISEDGDPAAATAQAPAPQPAAAGADDVLVLTEEVEDEPAEPHLDVPPSAPEQAAPPQAAEEPRVKLAEPEPEPAAPAAAAQFGRRLISEGAANASLAALSELVNRTQRDPAIESLPMGQSNRTLEDLTRELLRPMLKAWLDENLPPLVERIVREEIGRLALDAQRR